MAGPARRRVRRLIAGVVLAGVAVLIGIGVRNGGFFHTGDAWAGRGTPVKFANEPAPPQPDDAFVVGLGGVMTDLDARVVASGGLIRPVAPVCNTATIRPAFTCRITYLGEVVTYHVTTTPSGPGNYTWRARPDALVATRSGIEAAMWRTYSSRATAMSCDTALPAVQRVRPGAALRRRCYFKPVSGDPAFGQGSDNNARTVAVQVSVFDGGLTLEPVTQ
jgi:hypothetical protein